MTSLSEPQAQKLVEEEEATALQLWIDQPIQVLTAILIGNNIFNVASSALATELANQLLRGTQVEHWAIPAAIGVMTFLLLTFGEITPKSIAKKFSLKLAGPIMFVLRFPYFIFRLPTAFFSRMTNAIMRKLGSEEEDQVSYVTAEEIEYMIDLGSREGTFSEDRERLLRSVFEFPDTTVREVMVPRTETIAISVDMPLETIVKTLVECGHSRIPVYEESVDEIVGLFYAKDLIRLTTTNGANEFDIEDYLRPPYFVPESKGIAELLSEFQAERMHMAIVVDEFGGTAGLITLEDIIEEFFGDIQDEYDVEPAQIMRLDSNTVRADARIPIDKVEEFCDIELPEHPDYETLGGFVMDESGTVPEPGDEIIWEHVVFRIVEADQKRVITVDIEMRELPEEPDESEETLEDSELMLSDNGSETTPVEEQIASDDDEDDEDDGASSSDRGAQFATQAS